MMDGLFLFNPAAALKHFHTFFSLNSMRKSSTIYMVFSTILYNIFINLIFVDLLIFILDFIVFVVLLIFMFKLRDAFSRFWSKVSTLICSLIVHKIRKSTTKIKFHTEFWIVYIHFSIVSYVDKFSCKNLIFGPLLKYTVPSFRKRIILILCISDRYFHICSYPLSVFSLIFRVLDLFLFVSSFRVLMMKISDILTTTNNNPRRFVHFLPFLCILFLSLSIPIFVEFAQNCFLKSDKW